MSKLLEYIHLVICCPKEVIILTPLSHDLMVSSFGYGHLLIVAVNQPLKQLLDQIMPGFWQWPEPTFSLQEMLHCLDDSCSCGLLACAASQAWRKEIGCLQGMQFRLLLKAHLILLKCPQTHLIFRSNSETSSHTNEHQSHLPLLLCTCCISALLCPSQWPNHFIPSSPAWSCNTILSI